MLSVDTHLTLRPVWALCVLALICLLQNRVETLNQKTYITWSKKGCPELSYWSHIVLMRYLCPVRARNVEI